MRDLLSNHARRQLTLLEYLIEHPVATLAQISDATGYASRTLWQDAKEANSYLEPIKIEATQNGLQLVVPQGCSVRTIYNRLLGQSKEYNLLEYLFLHEGETLEELAESLFLSLSTLRRMIVQMNKTLEKSGILISTSPAQILGDELSVSQFFIALFSEKYYDLSYLLNKEECYTMNLLFERIMKDSAIELNFPDLQKMRIWGYVRLVRMRYNHPIVYENEKKLWREYPFLQDAAFLAQFYAVFSIRMDEALLLQMFQVLFGGQYAASYTQLQEMVKQNDEQKKLYDKVIVLLNNLAKQLNISLQGTERMQLNIYNMLQLSSYRYFIIYSRSRQFIDGFARDNKSIVEIFYTQVSELLGCTRDNYICDDVTFTLITEWPDLIDKIDAMVPEIRIGVLFDSNMKHAEFVQRTLSKHSRLKVSVAVPRMFSTFSGQIPGKDLDILVTDIPGIVAPGVEVVCVQEYPSEKDWQDILLVQERVFSQKMKGFAFT